MLVKIALIVSLCGSTNMDSVRKKVSELEAANPGAKVTVRIDKKASCSK